MIFYIVASLKLDPQNNRVEVLRDWLNTGFKQFSNNSYHLTITTNPLKFLDRAGSLAKSTAPAPPPDPNPPF